MKRAGADVALEIIMAPAARLRLDVCAGEYDSSTSSQCSSSSAVPSPPSRLVLWPTVRCSGTLEGPTEWRRKESASVKMFCCALGDCDCEKEDGERGPSLARSSERPQDEDDEADDVTLGSSSWERSKTPTGGGEMVARLTVNGVSPKLYGGPSFASGGSDVVFSICSSSCGVMNGRSFMSFRWELTCNNPIPGDVFWPQNQVAGSVY
jgi:hypothetical protein